jgi:hypothetical protein
MSIFVAGVSRFLPKKQGHIDASSGKKPELRVPECRGGG